MTRQRSPARVNPSNMSSKKPGESNRAPLSAAEGCPDNRAAGHGAGGEHQPRGIRPDLADFEPAAPLFDPVSMERFGPLRARRANELTALSSLRGGDRPVFVARDGSPYVNGLAVEVDVRPGLTSRLARSHSEMVHGEPYRYMRLLGGVPAAASAQLVGHALGGLNGFVARCDRRRRPKDLRSCPRSFGDRGGRDHRSGWRAYCPVGFEDPPVGR